MTALLDRLAAVRRVRERQARRALAEATRGAVAGRQLAARVDALLADGTVSGDTTALAWGAAAAGRERLRTVRDSLAKRQIERETAQENATVQLASATAAADAVDARRVAQQRAAAEVQL